MKIRKAAITGGSSGLGEEFARQLAAGGTDLILAARRKERLDQVKAEIEGQFGVTVEVVVCDLADEAQSAALAARLAEEAGLDLLVNNAGFGTLGLYHETDFARQEAMLRVHVLATMRLTRAVLPGMIARGAGAVVNVSSVAGYWRSAQNVMYCSTKGWMNDFTEGLRLELDQLDSPVVVQALCPGFTYSEFHDTLGVDRGNVPKGFWMQANFVVGESLKSLESGRVFVIPGWRYRLVARLAEWLPARWRMALERRSPHKRRKARTLTPNLR
ncbi:MAG: SDR family oxidoreductase [Bryobacteraceae bacterium]|nr:SDR family oxidoreductase [Solibacteraceae bacterium]MCO5351493.1 SDR family oxidoreductase [Bryobacteraceae bacterium]